MPKTFCGGEAKYSKYLVYLAKRQKTLKPKTQSAAT